MFRPELCSCTLLLQHIQGFVCSLCLPFGHIVLTESNFNTLLSHLNVSLILHTLYKTQIFISQSLNIKLGVLLQLIHKGFTQVTCRLLSSLLKVLFLERGFLKALVNAQFLELMLITFAPTRLKHFHVKNKLVDKKYLLKAQNTLQCFTVSNPFP